MSKSNWKQIRQAMRELPAPAPATEREDFWRQFHARALPQSRDERVPTPAGWLGWSVLRYGAVAATVLIVGVVLAVLTARRPLGGPPNRVQALHVSADHSAVMI